MAPEEHEAAERVGQLRQQIDEHNRRYYEEAAPTISDREYDQLFRELSDLEKDFPQLAAADSPTQRVGGKPLKAFAQITHRVPMLSLDNTYSEEEVKDFYRRMERLLPNQKIPVVIEPKVDGVAVSLLYEKGRASLRRDARRRNMWATILPKISRRFAGPEAPEGQRPRSSGSARRSLPGQERFRETERGAKPRRDCRNSPIRAMPPPAR